MLSGVNKAIRDTILEPLLELTSTRANTPIPTSQQFDDAQNTLDFALELDEIEDQLDRITSTAFNFETLEFRPGTVVLSQPDAITDALLPTARSTHNFVYRVNGLKNLALELNSLQENYGLSISSGAEPTDVTRCDSLLATVNLTVNGLFTMAHGCYKEKHERDNENRAEGIRSYQFVTPYSTGRFLPPVVMATTLLIAIIHSLMNLTRNNCNGILLMLRAILRLALDGQNLRTRSFVQANINTIPITLGTALIYLGLPTQLDVYVTCPKFSHLYILAETNSVPERCNATDLARKRCNESLFNTRHRGNSQWDQPIRQYSHQRLEVWLSKFLCRPEIEDLLEQAHPEPEGAGTTDFWGAPFLADFPKNEPGSFFDAPKNELRLVFMVYHDFFNPYSNMIAGKKYSTGMVIMVCLNLPPDICYDRENVYLAAVIPGPSFTTEERPKLQPAEDQMNHFMRPIADNLSEHFDPGVWIARTAKYPRGRKVRSAAPITSMDVPASRDWAGLGSHAHNILCSFCLIVQAYIDVFKPNAFPRRDMEQHRLHVEEWKSATTAKERAEIWSKYGARYSEWLRFPWWDIGTGIPFAPMHWTKNILEKQLRLNMGWSLTNPAGVPEPVKLKPITILEKEWSRLALNHCSVEEFELPELLLRHLCREHKIYETGLPSSRMVEDLNDLRRQQGVIDRSGQVVKPTPRLCVPERGSATSLSNVVTLAKAEVYLSRAKKPSLLLNNSNLDDLFLLCAKFNIPYHMFNTKAQLASRLMEYYKNIRIEMDGDDSVPSKPVSWLGYEVLRDVKDDMDETTIPSWIKAPPKNFASMSHGKIGAEEYKSLALISFTFTLIRLWGQAGTGALRERLDNFLHLTIAIRVLHYQTNSGMDPESFEHHYTTYLNDVKKLYPTCSIIPTQHYGLHIPFFLRQLGPGARFNENPAEMFVGMLQDIHTNFKHGDLGLTLHKEFNMAADLHALLQDQRVLDSIGEVGPSINQYLDKRFPSRRHLYSQGWTTSQEANAFQLDNTAYTTYSSWANSKGLNPISRHQHICSKIQHGHLVYQPYSHSAGNSHVLFHTGSTETPLPGRIESILIEHTHALQANSKPRITILVRQFRPLSTADQFYDPYGQHPIVGRKGYNIVQLCYNGFLPAAVILQPSDLVCHLATYNYQDVEQRFKRPCVALLSLDLKHASPRLFNSN